MGPLRVLLVGDDPLARAGLAALLANRAELTLAGEADPEEASASVAATGPDVVLWDLGVAGGTPEAPAGAESVPILALASDEPHAAEALRSGARGVLLRGAAPDALAAAVVAVARGLAVLEAPLAGEWLRPPDAPLAAEGLTRREREVLALLAEGLANKAIAARLGISEHTAKFHVNAILGKLGVESRAEAIVRAARLGLVAL
ncbi:response regulator transcription factor [Anaeromyxobacter sp. Fw109-5]|uniref:response regulator transcription factor n=1 Tax=Anaeromyxobacter sp. (strain Fw109-5) TaxID=404589 RepID=UPI000158A688|nr:response regulator transcription factor [Anaeromyxobacter sp. Fw109-5]ABS25124.1 two component transcriptional regulator, LuxR family [Anaeromyxobacter sp. Fw109-5]